LAERRRFGATEGEEPKAELARLTSAPTDVYRLAVESIHRRARSPQRATASGAVRRFWLPKDVAVLQYIVLLDRVEVFLLTRSGCRILSLGEATPRVDLWIRVQRTLANLLQQQDETWCPAPPLADLASRLGLQTIVDELPSSVRRLMVIPDDILAHVPFAALPVSPRGRSADTRRETAPLVAQYSIAMLPALGWLTHGLRVPRRAANALGVAVPRSEAAPRYSELTNAIAEIRRLSSVPYSSWSEPAIPPEATLERVSRDLAQAGVIHFACHGSFSAQRPGESGLLMQDGWLTVDRISELTLDSTVVAVLGACWGSNAVRLPGGVQIGLPYAFMERGVDAVIASLWEVADQDVEFAVDLHRNLAERGVLDALAATQRAWLGRLPASRWAGYVAHVVAIPARPIVGRLLSAARRIRRAAS